MTDDEIWKPVIGFEGIYKISSTGRLQKLVRGTWRLLAGNSSGPYIRYKLRLIRGKAAKFFRAHTLVLTAFVGEAIGKQVCRHLNGDRRDNRLKNLRWGTALENSQDMVCHGTQKTKLADTQVLEIRHAHRLGVEQFRLAEHFGVGRSTIHRIISRKRWVRLPA